MTGDGCCPVCGKELDIKEIHQFGVGVVRRIAMPCCPPPPTAEQLSAEAHAMWLAHHRRLATE